VTAFLLGVGVPTLLFNGSATGMTLILSGVAVTLCFVSLAFLASVLTHDKAKGIGAALLLWFYFTMLYDGLVLAVMFSFSDYPLEKAMIGLISLNPVDLARIILLLQTDISALMGYTGALYKNFFGGAAGMLYCTGIMLVWITVPLWLAVRVFRKKDL
jgi:Cu-processing system permease protein